MNRPKISQQPKRDTLKPPVACPWVANQPYPSPLTNKNRNSSQRRNSNMQTNNCLNNHWEGSSPQNGCTQQNENSSFCSMQQSSNQFFLFLRLMQLFPHTHPATLHSVMYICKNDFFCAIDKLLYAKRCKILYNNRRNQIQQRVNEKFTVINHIQSPEVNHIKRSFTKSRTDEENECDREAKVMKMNVEEVRVEELGENVNEVARSDGVKICEKLPDPEAQVEPIGAIKFITIKTNNIQDKLNVAELDKMDLKFCQEIS
ncbi:uncharacterized protein LOC123314956 [Coccinella septempunctata]|uniref:uncharacterized protein LOC123314956 n=1 Tax=Coccinella septempunctata TaxID=41139 RepID=UPI001D0986D0|nr:uncharacterized protein LOC123314956 [Coccinella septempunctata]XP_044756377.1 uncharacterized protein LOC123314956 [Coccinella septempunctata]XP_044756379.1 uncharacterized protein LOC123314956 [Coccinella septempunctata]